MSADGSGKVYHSKKDAWLVAVIWICAVISLGGAVVTFLDPIPPLPKALILLVCFAAAAICLWPLYTTRYILTAQELLVRCGPFRWRIRLKDIRSVIAQRNPISSPAVSMDRIQIRHRGRSGTIYISPEDKHAFMRDLAARVGHLEFDGEKVVGRAG